MSKLKWKQHYRQKTCDSLGGESLMQKTDISEAAHTIDRKSQERMMATTTGNFSVSVKQATFFGGGSESKLLTVRESRSISAKIKAFRSALPIRRATDTIQHRKIRRRINETLKTVQSAIGRGHSATAPLLKFIKQALLGLLSAEQSQLQDKMAGAMLYCINYSIDIQRLVLFQETLFYTGQLYLSAKKLGRAVYYLDQCRLCCMETNSHSILLKSLLSLAKCSRELALHEQTVQFLKKALMSAYLLNDRDSELEIYDRIGQAYYEIGMQEKATYFHDRFAFGRHECSSNGLKLMVLTKPPVSPSLGLQELTYAVLIELCLPIQPTYILASLSQASLSLRDTILPEDCCDGNADYSPVSLLTRIINSRQFYDDIPDPFQYQAAPALPAHTGVNIFERQLDCLLNRHMAKLHQQHGYSSTNIKSDRSSTFRIQRRHSLSTGHSLSIDTMSTKHSAAPYSKYFLRKESHTGHRNPMLASVRVFCSYVECLCSYT